nr:ABC transporter ATP-binding protein [Frankia sp. CiP3]
MTEPAGAEAGSAIDVRGLRQTYELRPAGLQVTRPGSRRVKPRRGGQPAHGNGRLDERGPRVGVLEAVRGIDFTVAHGEVFALLGPNGAGKTSTLEVLEGYRVAAAGEVRVLGYDPADRATALDLRRRIGIVLQDIAVDPYLTVAETVERRRFYYPDPRRTDEVLTLVGLTEKAKVRVAKLSGGQQRRLDLALGIVGRPRLLFLDEPTTGFDPSARRGAWDLVRSLRDLGTTILLTTHYMEEAQQLADRVAVMAAGRIVAEGPPDSLGGRDTAAAHITFTAPPGVRAADLPMAATVTGEQVLIETGEPTRTLHVLTGWAVDRGYELPGLAVTRPTLEDVYLQLTSARTGAGADADAGVDGGADATAMSGTAAVRGTG